MVLPGPRIIGEQEPQPGLAQETLVHGLKLVRQGLDVGYRDSRHLVGERDIDTASLHPQAELNRIAVKPQLTERLDDLNAGQLRLSEHVLARSRRPVEEKLPERPWAHRDQRYRFILPGKPDLSPGRQTFDVNSHCQTLPVSSPHTSTPALSRCRALTPGGRA